MRFPFQIAGGSVAGQAHRVAIRNNQDALCWSAQEDGLAAVVCDGCGSGRHSEVGAQLGARLVVQAAMRRWHAPLEAADLLEEVRREVLAHLRVLANAMSRKGSADGDPGGLDFAQSVKEYFLFTIVGVLVRRGRATNFSIGDGLWAVNGEVHRLGPFPENEPPYLGYALLGPRAVRGFEEDHGFEIQASLREEELDSLLLGTDGALDLEEKAERRLHGREEQVRPLSQFWTEDRFFENPDMVRRRLAVIQRGPQGGLLADDTTLVVIRRGEA
jgi:hypothetical protein